MVSLAVELLAKCNFIGRHIRKIYKHVLIDEFQDINYQQYQMMKYIAQQDPTSLFVVADDD
jgi:DNA helicase-2/ATP-dependent DNA helicase PcrA